MPDNPAKTPNAVGVTGGIGSGKTEVCNAFASLGARVWTADELAKDLLATHPDVRKQVTARFGSDVYAADGSLDRKRLARLAFADDGLLTKLNAIVHPKVTEELRAVIAREKAGRTAPLIVVEAALIFEARIEDLFDYVIAVEASEPLRVERAAKRDGATQESILSRMRAQLAPDVIAERADFVVRNAGDLAGLRSQCAFLFNLLSRIQPPSPAGQP
jgi:dephospho-CoA kinase